MKTRWSLVLAFAVTSLPGPSVLAQGRTDYLNFEAPQVKPITVATVDGEDYLLCCNTPDNSVEVYHIDLEWILDPPLGYVSETYTFVTRIPVGLEPVSVAYHAFDGGPNMMYTANWLGDSVTYVALSRTGDPIAGFSYNVTHTVDVGDEPMCIAILDDAGSALDSIFVTKRSASSYSQLDPISGKFRDASEVGGMSHLGGGADVIMTSSGAFPNPNGMFQPVPTTPVGELAVKEPHTVAVNGTDLWVLGHQGGGSKLLHDFPSTNPPNQAPLFNLDLWGVDLTDPSMPALIPSIGFQLGGENVMTTNFNMAFEGSDLYVVGTDALNDGVGNPALLAKPTGFVRTMLVKFDTASGSPTFQFRDLNTSDGTTPVVPSKALAHVTDVEVYDPQGSAKDLACVVAFNNDRFGLVDTSASNPDTWSISYVDIPALRHPGRLAGPRGVAIRETNDPILDRAYVLCRLDNSVAVIGLNGGTAPSLQTSFLLQSDPIPEYIRRGQQFLYGATAGKFSDKGFVSCASCHIDGRSDQLQWRLTSEEGILLPTTIQSPLDISVEAHEIDPANCTGVPDPMGINQPVPACVLTDLESSGVFPDQVVDDNTSCDMMESGESDNDKGPMITQSLQGLLNFEVGGNGFGLVTNAPYHWRGDKASFLDFNEAFMNLQGAPAELDPTEMAEYEEFINSIHYPPNPVQDISRTYSGELGDPNNSADGSAGLRGLKLFHIVPSFNLPESGGRSCVQCHTLPEGSDNRLTFIRNPIGNDPNNDPSMGLYPSQLKWQPMETAALRGLMQKEGRLELGSLPLPTALVNDLRTGDMGMGHEGRTGLTRNGFVAGIVTGPCVANAFFEVRDIVQYMREFDHGVAPVVGKTVSVFLSEVSGGTIIAPTKASLVAEMEVQTRDANAGIAVYGRLNGIERGFWYRVDLATAAYQETPGPNTFSLASLLGLMSLSSDVLVFTATPLGTDRRHASLNGMSEAVDGGVAPSVVKIIGTTPNSANAPIPSMTANLIPTGGSPLLAGFRSLAVLDDLQNELINRGAIPGPRHDAPRRLRVTGNNLFPGAQIRIAFPVPGSPSTRRIVLPIFPTDALHAGKRVWETSTELEPLVLYVLMLGGFRNQNVRDHLAEIPGAGPFPPSPFYTFWAKNQTSTWASQVPTQIKY